ncbi:hypothetical protein K466DRAFT_662188 [Polyporus arcularius HHB13444]|uniref:Uncharacterized protein n=1 Tax=Polyporus arcularius HHB13444 TaxID=1314778 RepID=A0A5C3PG76_9APHY|nr:hypothetical protein K466DRAFT_662188 [Polyporus arcularius HHB13444]
MRLGICTYTSGRCLLATGSTPPAKSEAVATMSMHQRHYAKKTSSPASSSSPEVEPRSGIPTEAERYWSKFFNPSDTYLRSHRASTTPAQASASARLTERERRRFAEMVVSAAGVQDEESSQNATGAGAYAYSESTPMSPERRDATPTEPKRTSKKMKAKTKKTAKSSTSDETGQE